LAKCISIERKQAEDFDAVVFSILHPPRSAL
jgi:hypothetical protein